MKESKKTNPTEKAKNLGNLKSDKTDPNGSYTGICEKENELPVQDADDL